MLKKQPTLSLKKQYFASIIASFGCVCAGSVLGWTSPVLPQLEAINKISETEGGILGSIVAIGAMAAALPAGYASSKLGPIIILKYLTGFFIIGWTMLSTLNDIHLFYLARFLGGFASGAVCVCVPIYIADIASVSVRGILGSFFQISFCAGIFLVNLFGIFFTWRQLSGILAAFPFIHFIALHFTPQTSNVEIYEEKGNTFMLLKQRKNIHSLTIGIGLIAFQQLSGANAVVFYTSGIFLASGSTLPAGICAVIVTCVNIIFSVISASLIEKLNRRVYLLISSIGMFISLILLGGYFHSKNGDLDFDLLAYLPLFSLILFMISFCMGYGPIPWLMLGEIFSDEFKNIGCGVVTMFNWLLVFLVTCTFPVICSQFGEHATFYLFAGFNLLGVIFSFYCVPETRGKSISEIQNLL